MNREIPDPSIRYRNFDRFHAALGTLKYNPINCHNVYLVGSRLYGSHNEKSDYDYVAVVETIPPIGSSVIDKEDNANIEFYTKESFKSAVEKSEIKALECIYAPPLFVFKEHLNFGVKKHDLGNLRQSISTISSNSWVKGKKKLIIAGDYDLSAGLKSIFHSIRILGLGIQIAREGVIVDYSEYNWLLTELWEMSKKQDRDELWEAINTRYHPEYKKLSTEFKKLAPKINENVIIRGKKVEIAGESFPIENAKDLKTVKRILEKLEIKYTPL